MDHLPDDVRAALESDMTIDITTTGRRSGRPSRIEIWFINVDGTIYITGTPGPRDWFANLRVNPAFVFHLKESVEADLHAMARVVEEPNERRRVIESAAAQWYRSQTPVDELIDSAPIVRVAFAG